MDNSPIVIGGMGGSGTRIIAKILIKAGVFLGNDLNKALDNLVFTRLFKDPIWFKTAGKDDIIIKLKLFEKYMTNQVLNLKDFKTIFVSFQKNKFFYTPKSYYLKFLINYFIDKKSSNKWGWKEPNTHIYLEYLAEYFTHLKYIHVIRNGLDMAFSKNRQQLYNWGSFWNIDILKDKMPIYCHQLNYWIKSNKSAIEISRNILGQKFYLLNYDQFCLNAYDEITKLMKFLNIDINENEKLALSSLIKSPKSIGRAMNKDLSIFSKEQLKEVENLGFDLSNYKI